MTIFASIHQPNDAWLSRAEQEPVLDPELPIIDAHLHLWDFNGHRYFLEEYARDLDVSGHNVEASVFVECFSMYRADGPEHLTYIGETEFAVGIAAMAASGKYTRSRVASAIVGYADLTLGEQTREVLEAHVAAANGRFRGVRQRAKWDSDPVVKGRYSAPGPGLYLDPAFGRGIDLLTSLGLSFDASIYHPQLPDVTALARAHPDARIVLIHCASPVGHSSYSGKEAENYAVWLSGMRELSKCPNVCVKLGGLLMNIANFDFTTVSAPPTSCQLAQLWRPWLEPCIEMFGAERCMVSSNFPVDKAGFGYGTVWNMFKHIVASCSMDEKRSIFSETAKRVYRLP
jgi:L-fuconolactonase